MLSQRIELYKELEEKRGSKLLVYITGDRQGMETQIARDVIDYFIEHLDVIGSTRKISLLLYTQGGNTLAAWNIVNLIRQFCDEFEVIVPSKAHSAGTLMCLGANKILMTKQATLGPIDPSVNTPLNPQIPNAGPNARIPVSVEAIKGFLELAKDELSIKDDASLTNVLIKLADMVHPLVLGEVYRARTQIQMLAEKLLKSQVTDSDKVKEIISFLCSDSGSHDYTINRREASEQLGLSIDRPDEELYNLLKNIFKSIKNELELNIPFDPNLYLGSEQSKQYQHRRVLLESVNGGCDVFVSEGILQRTQIHSQQGILPQMAINDQRLFEGWRHESV